MIKRGKALTAIDLFAGCGGLTYGLKSAGFTVKAALEKDPVAAATYTYNHPSALLLVADIRNIDPRKWMQTLGLAPGQLDLLAGCPPCQGFSVLRTRNGSKHNRDKQNTLVIEMLRFIKAFQPKTVMVENVPRLREHALFRTFQSQLRRLGYIVNSVVEDARFFGVPQRRRRLILLAGFQKGVNFARRSKQLITVRQAIGFLPQPGNSGDPLHDFPERRLESTRKRILNIPKNGGSRSDLPKDEQLPCHRKCDGYKDIYGRLAWDKVAPTITTGCYNPSKGRFLHPQRNRCITMREAALLQSFPFSFQIAPGTTKTQAARMIGNALPPEFIRRHAVELRKAILTQLARTKKRTRMSTARGLPTQPQIKFTLPIQF
jgi:DNA (cytosine-5)-methyltransferase 1